MKLSSKGYVVQVIWRQVSLMNPRLTRLKNLQMLRNKRSRLMVLNLQQLYRTQRRVKISKQDSK